MGRTVIDHRLDGRWVRGVNRGGQTYATRMGSVYYSMRQRCIPAQRRGNAILAYAGVKLHRDWAEFQSFAEWYSSQPGFRLKWELDKDLLLPGNKVYAPDRCCLLPRKINAAIRIPRGSLRLPGVKKLRDGWAGWVGNKYLGKMPTELEAHQLYCNYKETNVKTLAEAFKSQLCPRAYAALMNWTVAAYMA